MYKAWVHLFTAAENKKRALHYAKRYILFLKQDHMTKNRILKQKMLSSIAITFPKFGFMQIHQRQKHFGLFPVRMLSSLNCQDFANSCKQTRQAGFWSGELLPLLFHGFENCWITFFQGFITLRGVYFTSMGLCESI